MYKEDLALNNLQGLICHKIQQPSLKEETKTIEQIYLRIFELIY